MGTLESVQGGLARGWAYDPKAPADRVQLEVVEGQRLLAVGTASLPRSDLKARGLGDGGYGFEIALPSDVLYGGPHRVSVRASKTGEVLAGSPVTLGNAPQLHGAVEGLDGSVLYGWVRDRQDARRVFLVEVVEYGETIVAATSDMPHEKGGVGRFRVPLPPKVLDGRVHAFLVLVRSPSFVVGELGVVTPYILTPEQYLRRLSGPYLKGYLSPIGPLRYESLRRHLVQLLIEQPPEEEAPAANASRKGAGKQLPGTASLLERLRSLVRIHEQVIRGFGESGREFAPLELEAPAKPRVSVVIPVHNKLPVTYNCLASLCFATNQASFEVIVVDDGSADETTRLQDIVRGVRYVRHESPRGFVHSCNDGARVARGEYVVLLNNDTEVTSGWLDELLHAFGAFDKVGLVGAKLLYPDGTLQEAGGIVWGNGEPWNYGRNGNAHDPRYNYIRQVDYLSGACVMLPKSLWDSLGGFDEHFAPAYYEDTDLAFRVREKGYRVVYTPFCQVVHFEGLTSGTSVETGAKRFQAVNAPKFKSRWAPSYCTRPPVGTRPELAKDSGVLLRALVIDAEVPRPDRDAGSYAAIQEIRLLQSLGFKVTFVPENLAYMGSYTEALQHIGVECQYAPFCLSVQELIALRGAEFDLFYITRYGVAEKYIDAIRQAAPRAKILFNNADLHFLRLMRAAAEAADAEAMEKAAQVREAELAVMGKVDVVLSYNETEHAVIFSHNPKLKNIARCPWVVATPERTTGFDQRRDVAFLGGFGHHPNVEAVEFFVREVMPPLRQALPGVRFLVYGSQVPNRIEALAAEDIVIKGWVERVEDVYDTCRVFVAPLKSGAGIKGKVIGALAHGVPTVLSPVAAEGIGLRDGQDTRIVTTPGQWVEAISHLYRNKSEWQRMASNARSYTREAYSFARGKELMRAALEAADLFVPEQHGALVSRVSEWSTLPPRPVERGVLA